MTGAASPPSFFELSRNRKAEMIFFEVSDFLQ